MPAAAEQLQRLREVRATGHMPDDLLDWVLPLVAVAARPDPASLTPRERLALSLSEQLDAWMTRRHVTARRLSVPRRTLARALKGGNLHLSSIADLADALNCDAVIEFRPRERPQVAPVRP